MDLPADTSGDSPTPSPPSSPSASRPRRRSGHSKGSSTSWAPSSVPRVTAATATTTSAPHSHSNPSQQPHQLRRHDAPQSVLSAAHDMPILPPPHGSPKFTLQPLSPHMVPGPQAPMLHQPTPFPVQPGQQFQGSPQHQFHHFAHHSHQPPHVPAERSAVIKNILGPSQLPMGIQHQHQHQHQQLVQGHANHSSSRLSLMQPVGMMQPHPQQAPFSMPMQPMAHSSARAYQQAHVAPMSNGPTRSAPQHLHPGVFSMSASNPHGLGLYGGVGNVLPQMQQLQTRAFFSPQTQPTVLPYEANLAQQHHQLQVPEFDTSQTTSEEIHSLRESLRKHLVKLVNKHDTFLLSQQAGQDAKFSIQYWRKIMRQIVKKLLQYGVSIREMNDIIVHSRANAMVRLESEIPGEWNLVTRWDNDAKPPKLPSAPKEQQPRDSTHPHTTPQPLETDPVALSETDSLSQQNAPARARHTAKQGPSKNSQHSQRNHADADANADAYADVEADAASALNSQTKPTTTATTTTAATDTNVSTTQAKQSTDENPRKRSKPAG